MSRVLLFTSNVVLQINKFRKHYTFSVILHCNDIENISFMVCLATGYLDTTNV